MDRRVFVGLLAVGLACAVTGCGGERGGPRGAGGDVGATPGGPTPSPTRQAVAVPPLTGDNVLFHGAENIRQIALTVDDGYNTEVVAGYVHFAVRTGVHLTFSPNGQYDRVWAPHREILKPLIERGQVQFINHTFNHPNMLTLSDARIREELDRNEEWLQRTFNTSGRPYYRPPFGSHNAHVDGVAAELGFRNAVMWNGSFSDSSRITPEFLMESARRYLKPGVIMLGHANHPTILGLFDQIMALIRERDLTPVTLNEMFGTVSGGGPRSR